MTNYQFNTIRTWLKALERCGNETATNFRIQAICDGHHGAKSNAVATQKQTEYIRHLLCGLIGEFVSKGGSVEDADQQLAEEKQMAKDSFYRLQYNSWYNEIENMGEQEYEQLLRNSGVK